MFSDYKRKVIACYQEKQRNGSLASNLTILKPAKLRDECLMVYTESTKSSDENTLRTFFGPKGNRPDYSHAIQQVNTEKFKSLIRFLNGKTTDTNSTNIELLAWLINYEPRPYQFSFRAQPEQTGPIGQVEPVAQPDLENEDFKISESEVRESISLHSSVRAETVKTNTGNYTVTRPKARRMYTYLLAMTAVCTGGAYLYNTNEPNCMYWEGSNYRIIDCDEKIPGVMILPFDAHKIKHFKRITRPDTLDYHHVGSTWYTKAGMDSVEFFTDAGTHPASQKGLRPVTKYIIRKYVKKED